jgi:potassium channel subfamily K
MCILGLVISSISKFATELSDDNVVKKHANRIRTRTLQRCNTGHHLVIQPDQARTANISKTFRAKKLQFILDRKIEKNHHVGNGKISHRLGGHGGQRRATLAGNHVHPSHHNHHRNQPRKRTRPLREERERFDEMRRIQLSTRRFRRWYHLVLSVMAFAILWIVGSIIIWQAERHVQQMSYFQSLYFCYVSLLTIGNHVQPAVHFFSLMSYIFQVTGISHQNQTLADPSLSSGPLWQFQP